MTTTLSVRSLTAAVASTTNAIKSLPINNVDVVVGGDMLILSFFFFFAVVKLPRFFLRFSRKSEWSLGHFFRAGPSIGSGDQWKRNVSATSISDTLYSATMETGSEDSHTEHSHASNYMHEKNRPYILPPSQSYWSQIHGVFAFFDRPVTPGYSVGRLLIIMGYYSTALFMILYRSNPFVDGNRLGYVSVSQIPLIYALGTKNNILGMLLARGYEKLNYLHRAVGTLIILVSNFHALGYFFQWSLEGIMREKLSQPKYYSVLISLMGLNLVFVFSTEFWRQKCYRLFIITHMSGILIFPIALCVHTPQSVPWVAAALVIYGLDHIVRILKTRISEATLRPVPDLGLTRVEIPALNAGWRAGQHVRIRVLSSGMGLFGWTEAHPFTIASVGGDGMLLMCKKAGDWTNKLYSMASDDTCKEKGAIGRSVKVMLEGPYGGVGNTLMDNFSGALFVTGGSGISFALAAIQDLIQKDTRGSSNVRVIDLVWSVQNPGSLQSMLPTFSALIQQAPRTTVRVSVFYTRSSSGPDASKMYGYLPANIVLTPGRPKIPSLINTIIDDTCALVSGNRSGLLVAVCGPMGLGQQVREAVSKVDNVRCDAIGGVELCDEVFGW